jgi:hypothetical protein
MTMHIMSKCPYGVKVAQAITPVARKLGNRFKINLEYIGREENGELTSMHGEAEVAGNKLQLCAHEHGTYEQWLAFLDCQNENWRSIPEGWERCAETAGVEVAAVRTCFQGEEGTNLLRASYERSTKAGASGSPTIFVGEDRYSGGRTEDAFARAICARYGEGAAPAYCANIPPPPAIPATVLVDRRCTREECDVEQQLAGMRGACPGLKAEQVDATSARGRELMEKSGVKMLPALLVGNEVQQDQDCYRSLRGMKRSGDQFVQTLGRFDPTTGTWLERPVVPIQLLVDSRCKSRECTAVDRFEDFIKRQVPKASISRIEYNTDQGKALWGQYKTALDSADEATKRRPAGLPAAFFGKTIEQEDELYSRLQRRFVPVGDQLAFQLGPWDPGAEICDNETDDDGDGQSDCRDDQCASQMVCRAEKARSLTAFVMSQCPYGVQVLNAMDEVLKNFGRDRTKIDFRIGFVGQVGPEGELSTMHGEGELNENLREICAQQHYPQEYAFMDYVLCRNKNIRSDEWESCATGPVKADVIRTCAEGDEGRALLRASFEEAKALGFTGSPSWLLNNRYELNGRDPESIKTEFCTKNEQPECSNTLTKGTKAGPGGPGGPGGGGSCG